MTDRQPPANAGNFGAIIRHWADTRPEALAFNFMRDGEVSTDTLTYAELDMRVRAVAALLQQHGLNQQPVLLQYRPDLDFIVAFMACLYAGAIAVPAYPPTGNRSKSDRLQKLIDGCGARAILTNALTLPDLTRETGQEQPTSLPVLRTDDIGTSIAGDWRDPGTPTDAVAFLQYSSGSTGDPKGVIVTHANILCNQMMIRQAMGTGPQTVFASWLPLFHDMGLIGNIMQPLYLGVACHLMPPMAFLQKPRRWLQVISDYRVTCTGGPNFSYDLCVDKVVEEDRSGLDLSSLTVLYNGAEPVRAETQRRFLDAYRHCGLSDKTLFPCYGLAEATLFVTGPGAGVAAPIIDVDAAMLESGRVVQAEAGAGRTRALVGCGIVWQQQKVWIVDPETRRRRSDGEVGEIWLQGPNISHGYWRRPDADAAIFQPCADAPDAGLFCRTGDLGTMIDGQLYVTGRLKEVLIVRGRNHYPQDIEATVQAAWPGFVRGGGAAFINESAEGEQLVVVQEVARTALRRYSHDKVFRLVQESVACEHGLTLAHLVAIRPATLAKTSSGKIRRGYMKSVFLAGRLAEVDQQQGAPPHAPVNATAAELSRPGGGIIEQSMLDIGIDVMRVRNAGNLLQAGLDSLQLIELQARLEKKLNASVPIELLFDDKTLAEVEASLRDCRSLSVVDDTPAASVACLTPYQLSIWLHQQRATTPVFNLATAIELPAGYTSAQIERAIAGLLSEHALLRSRVVEGEDGRLFWEVCGDTGSIVEWHDAADWSEPALDHWLCGFRARPFELEQQPPLRVALLQRGTRGIVVALCAHHIAIDLHGATCLIERLLSAIAGRQADESYADDMTACAILSASADTTDTADTDWLDRLAGASAQPDFGFVAADGHAGTCTTSTLLDYETLAHLKTLAAKTGCTLNTVLAAAFAALLYRYTGQDALALGVPVSVRPPSLRNWPGNAVNILPLPWRFDNEVCWTGLLQQAASAGTRVLRHRYIPYIKLLEAVRERHPQVGTLYGAVFACQPERINGRPLPFGGGSVSGINCAFREIPAPACQAPLQLLVYPGEHGASLQLEYDTRRIPGGFAQAVLAHYQGMLTAMLREPEGRIAEAGYLPASEIDMQWRQWNIDNIGATAVDCDLVTRLLQQSARCAEAIAVIDAGGSFTYEEFARVAAQYCAGLKALGVVAGDRVGIALPRDRYLPAAIVGALMCGAAYVPLDLDYPEERLRYILDNSRAKIVVTTAAQAGHFEGAGVDCFFYRDDLPSAKPVAVPSSTVAYVLYTSGSTGQPKGVKVSHGSIVTLIDWASRILSERERERVLASTSVCFDLSVFEFFVPLCLGTTCVVVNRILDLLDGVPAPVTLINTVPSAIDALVGSGAIPDSVETALVAGEPFRQHLVERLYHTSRVRRVLDLYGPTEDTVYSTCAERRPGGLETIGRPVGGGRAYILDANQQPVPAGLPGELYLAGAGLSEGYERRPDLTSAAFTTPVVLRHLEQRCYRTGDIVRYASDGRLIYLGRRDYQIKLRGYRIELLEVEAVLQAYTAVQQAVAQVVTLQNGEAVLVAYVVWDSAAAADPDGLREHATRRLPAYMCPAMVMSLATLPRTLNGKIDRKALPVPDVQLPAQSTLEDATDIALAEVWAEVLRNKPLHRDTHFVDMGGSSLSAVQLRAAIRRRFDADIPLALLLAHPTLGEQSDLLRQQQRLATTAGQELEEIEL